MTVAASKPAGFSLVEVTLALGVVAIALLGVFSLLPVGLKVNQIATQQGASADILSLIAADLRSTPITTPRGAATTSPQLNISIPANPVAANSVMTLYFSESGQSAIARQANSRYLATITFLPNGTGSRTATCT